MSFNTVNGKRCCNPHIKFRSGAFAFSCFNTVNGKRCCNDLWMVSLKKEDPSFNTVNGKRCCNT